MGYLIDEKAKEMFEGFPGTGNKLVDVIRDNKCVRHEVVCNLLNDIYKQKNTAYGDSFGETFRDLGIISAVTRISDKYNRLKTLARNTEIPQGDEAIADTLLDIANYCIMTYMELENDVNDKD